MLEATLPAHRPAKLGPLERAVAERVATFGPVTTQRLADILPEGTGTVRQALYRAERKGAVRRLDYYDGPYSVWVRPGWAGC